MLFSRRRRLGRRQLKLFSKGHDVELLQEKLAQKGYDLGDEKGEFGYLTQEALKAFQKDHRLRVDGIAGPEVFSLLVNSKPTIERKIHEVKRGETLDEIAKHYGVGEEAFLEVNRNPKLYPGEKLSYYVREVWGVVNKDHTTHVVAENCGRLTGVFYPVTLFSELGSKSFNARNIIASVRIEEDEVGMYIHRLLQKRKQRKKCLSYLVDLSSQVDGIHLSWTPILRVDGTRYFSFLKALVKMLPRNKKIFITLNEEMPSWNVLGGIPFSELASIVDRIVVSLPAPKQATQLVSKGIIDKATCRIRRTVPRWKTILQIPTFSVEWNENEENSPVLLSYVAAMSRIHQTGARLFKDEDGKPYYRIFGKNSEGKLWLTHHLQLKEAFTYVNLENYAGLLLDYIGAEDQRLWKFIGDHFQIK